MSFTSASLCSPTAASATSHLEEANRRRRPSPRIDFSHLAPRSPRRLELEEQLRTMRSCTYAFNVVVARILTPTERKHLRAIVEYLKRAHTHFVDLVEPFPPVVPDHWELGLSALSESTDLH